MILIDLEKGIGMIRKSYIIGLPESGKTTFLGALAYCLLYSNDNSYFKMNNIDDINYIKGLADVWSQCREVDRTSRNSYVITKLYLKDICDNQLELYIPDQSGEDFEDILKNRNVSDEMCNEIKNSDNILLFINPSKLSKDSFINDIKPEHRTMTQNKVELNGKNVMHEQTQYVSLLQDIYEIRKACTKLKVILSAWDIYNIDITPSKLLQQELPLVWQYLIANRSIFECEYWGISAQGGDLNDPEEKNRLRALNNPIERIQVISENKEKTHDLSVLLK